MSLPHSVHVDPPRAPLYFPAGHDVSTLDPKHANPTGHSAHEMRVLAVCPAVWEPFTHVRHAGAPVLLYSTSLPQFEHAVAPALLNAPAGQKLVELDPSHVWPAGHDEHVVLATVVPPDVTDPAAQVLQLVAASSEYFVSAPQSTHTPLPAGLNLPPAHGFDSEVPSQGIPAAHFVHANRVVEVPPLVAEPTVQVRHETAPAEEYWLSFPQEEQVATPPDPYFPAAHGVAVLLPSHEDPFGQGEQEARPVGPAPPAVCDPAAQVAQARELAVA